MHANMEKIIEEKMERPQAEDEYHDAFDYMLSSSKEHGHQLSIQELKVRGRLVSHYSETITEVDVIPFRFSTSQETAVELIFAAHSTTASASTSLVLQLLRHPAVVERARTELEAEGLGHESFNSPPDVAVEREEDAADTETSCLLNGGRPNQQSHGEGFPQSRPHVPYLSLDKLSQLRYVDCVVKEVLRFLPPVSGGYRTALQTFELDVSSSRNMLFTCTPSIWVFCVVIYIFFNNKGI